ncbi:MAG: hypothetical protein WBM44_28930, partial [Waterburya sp.]
ELESVLEPLKSIGVSCQVYVQPKHNRKHFEHARILEIKRQDGTKYKIIFDLGLDFLQVESNAIYSITKPTYIAIVNL